jgi:hypothetical protein
LYDTFKLPNGVTALNYTISFGAVGQVSLCNLYIGSKQILDKTSLPYQNNIQSDLLKGKVIDLYAIVKDESTVTNNAYVKLRLSCTGNEQEYEVAHVIKQDFDKAFFNIKVSII